MARTYMRRYHVLPPSLRTKVDAKVGCRNRTGNNKSAAVRTTWKIWVGSVGRVGNLGFARASAAEIASRTHNARYPCMLRVLEVSDFGGCF